MLKNIINTFFTRIFASVANLLIAIIISKVYGAEIKGEQGLILTTITLITLMAAIIGSGSLVYLTPRIKTKHLLLPSYLWNVIVCTSIFFILLQTDFIPRDYIWHTIILSFILTLSHIHSGALVGIEKIKQSNLAFLVNTIVILISLLFFVFILRIPTVYAYIYSVYIGYSIYLIFTSQLIFSNWNSGFNSINPGKSSFIIGARNLLKYGLFNQLDVIASMLSFRLSYYVINYYLSKSAVGIYSNAISIIESIWLISRSIAMVLNARIANSSDLNYSVKITLNLLKVSFCLVFFAVLVLIFIPSGFYQFLFGEEFGDVRLVIISISPGVLLFSTSFILSSLYAGTGKYIYNTFSSVVGLLVTVILVFILIPKYGIVGAGITASISYFAHVIVKVWIFVNKFPVSFNQIWIRRSDFNQFFDYLRADK